MAEALYETIFPEITTYAPNCPEPTVLEAVRDACYEFCTFTLFVTEEIDPISLIPNVNSYQIDCPRGGYEIIQVAGDLFIGGRALPAIDPAKLDRKYAALNWRTLTGDMPECFAQFKRDEITLVPVPSSTPVEVLTGRVALAPTRTSTRVDASLLSLYRTELAAGALRKICSIPDQPFSNPDMALFYGRVFSAAKGAGAARVRNSFNSAPLSVGFRKFW